MQIQSPVPGRRVRYGTHVGFVLVEVLVVALIVGLLAAVAIPVYSGYVESQRREVAKNLAQTAAAAANIHYRRTGSNPTSVGQLKLFLTDPAKYTIAISGDNIVVTDVATGNAETAAFR